MPSRGSAAPQLLFVRHQGEAEILAELFCGDCFLEFKDRSSGGDLSVSTILILESRSHLDQFEEMLAHS